MPIFYGSSSKQLLMEMEIYVKTQTLLRRQLFTNSLQTLQPMLIAQNWMLTLQPAKSELN